MHCKNYCWAHALTYMALTVGLMAEGCTNDQVSQNRHYPVKSTNDMRELRQDEATALAQLAVGADYRVSSVRQVEGRWRVLFVRRGDDDVIGADRTVVVSGQVHVDIVGGR